MIPTEVFLTFILMLTIFLGFELINKVPSTLHTPLMSGANAISGICLVGALSLAGTGRQDLHNWLAVVAVALATINVVGGYRGHRPHARHVQEEGELIDMNMLDAIQLRRLRDPVHLWPEGTEFPRDRPARQPDFLRWHAARRGGGPA